VKRLLRSRGKGADHARISEEFGNISDYLLTASSEVYRVRVDVKLSNGFADAAEAVIIQPQDANSSGYRTVAWSRVAPTGPVQLSLAPN
jgi:hypothetical protein